MSGAPFTPNDAARVLAEIERVRSVGCYVWDLTNGEVAWSDGFYRLLGLPPRAPGEKAPANQREVFYERMHPDDRERVRALHAEVARSSELPETTFRIVHPDGGVRVVRGFGAITRGEAGNVSLVVGAFIDVTESARVSGRLADAAQLLDETQRAAGAGSHIYDLTTGHREWSRSLYEILGLDPSTEPTPETSARLLHPDDRARQVEWGTRVARGEILPPLITRIIREDGSLRHLETRARLVDGEVGPRMVGISFDVTQRIELEDRLREAAKMEAIATLAAGVAHDFNNYLTVMALQLDAVAGPAASELEPALEAIEQCRRLTQQLLAFARKQPKASQVVDLAEAVTTVVRLLERTAGPHVSLRTSLPPEPSRVIGDRSLLDNAIMNLLLNACDAVAGGGTVTVELGSADIQDADPRLEAGCAPGRYATLAIADDGAGIELEHMPRLFEPYFSTKSPARGTGLGLASVYGIVKQHGGFVRVESAVGRGSTFIVYLPATIAQKPTAVATSATTTGSLEGVVLLVEDMPPLRRAAQAILSEVGLEVHVAQTGAVALDLFRTLPRVDLILTDVVMPGVGGIELARAITSFRPECPIVFMSGYADAAILEHIERELPDAAFIKKPFDREELIGIITDALRRRR